MAWWNWREWLWSSDPKWDADKVICEVDGEPTQMSECGGTDLLILNGTQAIRKSDGKGVDIVPSSFTKSLERRGFTFNSNNNRWSRTWTAKTRDGEERTLEVYEKKEDGEWISLMYGNEGDIYYQNSLGYEINTES